MKTLKSKLFFMTTLMMVITVFAGCPHKPINPPEPPNNNDSTETIKQQLEFKVVWKNTIGVDLEITSESNSVEGATINAINALLKDGEETEFASINKLVEIDSAHTLEMYKQEMLSSVVNSLNKISLRYFENGTMYSFSGNGELFKNINDYSEINDSLIRLNITKELFSREEFAITEGEEKSVEIKWQNLFTLPITIRIKSVADPNLNIDKQISPNEVVKIVDLSYYVYPNEDELNAEMLSNAMKSYKSSLNEVTFILPTIKDSTELTTGIWTGTEYHNALDSVLADVFDLNNYEFDNGYTLLLYNRLLYFDLGIPYNFVKYTNSVYWKNSMQVPMEVSLKYRKHKIYTYHDGDLSCIIQPGESYQMPDFVVYCLKGASYFESPWSSFWNCYTMEMDQIVITYGDKVYNKTLDGTEDFLNQRNYAQGYIYTFTEQSFDN